MSLRIEAVSVAYGPRTVVEQVTLEVPAGAVTALVGPNGSGKSSLLRAVAQIRSATAGRITVDDVDLASLGRRERARQLAFLPQEPGLDVDTTVEELVARGRYPHQSLLGILSPADHEAVDRALTHARLEGLRHRALATLSGGERQRAWIALTLAQEARIVVLDEPTSAMDVRHAVETMELLRRLAAEGRTILVVLHDLGLASRYAERVAVLGHGRLVASGTPSEVFVPPTLDAVFGIPMRTVADPWSGRPIPIPGDVSA